MMCRTGGRRCPSSMGKKAREAYFKEKAEATGIPVDDYKKQHYEKQEANKAKAAARKAEREAKAKVAEKNSDVKVETKTDSPKVETKPEPVKTEVKPEPAKVEVPSGPKYKYSIIAKRRIKETLYNIKDYYQNFAPEKLNDKDSLSSMSNGDLISYVENTPAREVNEKIKKELLDTLTHAFDNGLVKYPDEESDDYDPLDQVYNLNSIIDNIEDVTYSFADKNGYIDPEEQSLLFEETQSFHNQLLDVASKQKKKELKKDFSGRTILDSRDTLKEAYSLLKDVEQTSEESRKHRNLARKILDKAEVSRLVNIKGVAEMDKEYSQMQKLIIKDYQKNGLLPTDKDDPLYKDVEELNKRIKVQDESEFRSSNDPNSKGESTDNIVHNSKKVNDRKDIFITIGDLKEQHEKNKLIKEGQQPGEAGLKARQRLRWKETAKSPISEVNKYIHGNSSGKTSKREIDADIRSFIQANNNYQKYPGLFSVGGSYNTNSNNRGDTIRIKDVFQGEKDGILKFEYNGQNYVSKYDGQYWGSPKVDRG